MLRRTGASLLLLLALQAAGAHAAPWQPSPGHTQLPLWPGKVPNAGQVSGPEVAVVVFPGGGYNILAIDLEGSEACEWLASGGITAVLLKYRVPCAVVGPHRDCPTALQDAQRAMSLVRSHAAEWQIDQRRIGVLGFSAGGHMVASISTHKERIYSPVDSADREAWRPDFAVALYPGHLATRGGRVLNSDIRVTAQTPPTFLVQAKDDPIDPVENSIVYHAALKKAGVPAELHVFEQGRHGFGLRRTELPITRWPELMEAWLHRIGVLDGAPAQGSD